MVIQKKAVLRVEGQMTASQPRPALHELCNKKAETGSSKAIVKPQDPKIKQL